MRSGGESAGPGVAGFLVQLLGAAGTPAGRTVMDAGLEGGRLVEGAVNEDFPWPTIPAREAVRGRLRHLLLDNGEPAAPYVTCFVRQIDLPNLHDSGVVKHWLTRSGSPDEAHPYWTDDAWTALQERLGRRLRNRARARGGGRRCRAPGQHGSRSPGPVVLADERAPRSRPAVRLAGPGRGADR
ncbi:hypothetical protein QZN11_34345 [Streptomyces gramineus]|uniref:hypothetical protein n=1 Tax=Streptomyces gramineus TaxID=910542 RepID=UPI00398AAC25